jgi:hypothetical protein
MMTSPFPFRQRARDAVKLAKLNLKKGDAALRYAALELRLALEALCYERAALLGEELPPEAYRTWQPKKLLQQLLDLEPMIDKSRTISFGKEETPGVAASKMNLLGTETVLSMKNLKGFYESLGSFVHAPTLKQLEQSGDVNFDRCRAKCNELIAVIDKVLESKVFNSNFGVFSSINCMNDECKQILRRRLPPNKSEIVTSCFDCGLGYKISTKDDSQHIWSPLLESIACPSEGCDVVLKVMPKELGPGKHLNCSGCKKVFFLDLALFESEESTDANERS